MHTASLDFLRAYFPSTWAKQGNVKSSLASQDVSVTLTLESSWSWNNDSTICIKLQKCKRSTTSAKCETSVCFQQLSVVLFCVAILNFLGLLDDVIELGDVLEVYPQTLQTRTVLCFISNISDYDIASPSRPWSQNPEYFQQRELLNCHNQRPD